MLDWLVVYGECSTGPRGERVSQLFVCEHAVELKIVVMKQTAQMAMSRCGILPNISLFRMATHLIYNPDGFLTTYAHSNGKSQS